MNLLVVCHDNEMSGASKSLIDWISGFTDKKSVVFFVPITKRKEMQELLKREGYRVYVLPYVECILKNRYGIVSYFKNIIRRVIYYLQNIFIVRLAIIIAKNNKIDAIYSNTFAVDLGARMAKKMHVPHCWHIREFLKEDHNVSFIKAKQTLSLTKGSKAIFISKCLADFWNKKVYFKCSIVVYDRVENNSLDKLDHQNLNIIIVGQVKETKGQMQAIQAVQLLNNDYSLPCSLFICGEGPDLLQYKQYVKKNNLDNIFFLGRRNDLPVLRQTMDIGLVCSASEAFGRVSIEAFYSSNFVIASNRGANIELIEDGFNGFLFEYGNPKSLASQIIRYSNLTPDEKDVILQSAKEKAIRDFSKPIYSEIIDYIYSIDSD